MAVAIQYPEEIVGAYPVIIVGLGATGLSVARHLKTERVPFVVVDSRSHPPGLPALRALDPNIPFLSGAFDAEFLSTAKQLIVSPGVPIDDPAISSAHKKGIQVIGDIELFASQVTAPVAAITGSNGKSTATTLLAEMARQAGWSVQAGGNLGKPALDLLGDPQADLYVLELSSFQLETTFNLQPTAATVLNVTADHMDRYHDYAAYAAAKARIYRHAQFRVVNRNDPTVMAMTGAGREISFGLDEPTGNHYGLVTKDKEIWLVRGRERLINASRLRIPGRHNIANALATLALGEGLGLALDAMLSTLLSFPGLAHRCQWVAHHRGVSWYNDSKGTNIGATLAALQAMPGKVVLIAGGMAKDNDFEPLQEAVKDKARAVVLLGRDAHLIEVQLKGWVPVINVTDMRAAVHQAAVAAQSGDCVLLSPACASFDMYKNYIERGEAFMHSVQELVT